jgi:hypothetical protein
MQGYCLDSWRSGNWLGLVPAVVLVLVTVVSADRAVIVEDWTVGQARDSDGEPIMILPSSKQARCV